MKSGKYKKIQKYVKSLLKFGDRFEALGVLGVCLEGAIGNAGSFPHAKYGSNLGDKSNFRDQKWRGGVQDRVPRGTTRFHTQGVKSPG